MMYTKNGLVYWALDSRGNKVGVPIKASSLSGKPTLLNLEEKFKQGELLRKPALDKLKVILDGILQTNASPTGFSQALHLKGIQVIFRRNESQLLYGVTYVDHNSKVVFNGSDLGKNYSAAALNKLFNESLSNPGSSKELLPQNNTTGTASFNHLLDRQTIKPKDSERTVIDDLLRADYNDSLGINGMFQNKRKKKRKRLSR